MMFTKISVVLLLNCLLRRRPHILFLWFYLLKSIIMRKDYINYQGALLYFRNYFQVLTVLKELSCGLYPAFLPPAFAGRIIFLDIGANIGALSWYYSIIHKNIELILVEPDEENWKYLEKTFHSDNVQIIKKAVNDVETFSLFESVSDEYNTFTGSRVVNASDKPLVMPVNTSKVECISLNELLHCEPEYSFVKIDIEGAEKFVDFAVLNKHKINKLYLEIHPNYVDAIGSIISCLEKQFSVKVYSDYSLDVKNNFYNLVIYCEA